MFTKDVTFLEEGDEVWIIPRDDSSASLRYQVVRHQVLLVGSEAWEKSVKFIKDQRMQEMLSTLRPIKDTPQA